MQLKNWILPLIGLIFLIKLGDSLYVRQHGDALGYHLYAPLNWARFGLFHVNLFQSMHYQGGLLELLLVPLFKLLPLSELVERERVLVVFQVLSCTVGFLFIPWTLARELKRQFGELAAVLGVLVFFGCETLSWSYQFAKNDSWAAWFFLIGFFASPLWRKALFLSLACAVKPTYLYGAAILWLLEIKKDWRWLVLGAAILIGPGVLWVRNFLATGSPVFPIPSPWGLKTSAWLIEYFSEYAGRSNLQQAGSKAWAFFRQAPVIVLLGILMVWSLRLEKKTLGIKNWVLLLTPILYLFLTGRSLELRTYGGVVLVAVFVLVTQISWTKLHRALPVLVAVLALLTSKVDLSSWSRMWSARDKSYAELVRDGRTFEEINRSFGEKDAVLTLLTNEGWFLKPQILTANEHPHREELRRKFPMLEGYNVMITLRPKGTCDWTSAEFIEALTQSKNEDLKPFGTSGLIYELELECHDAG